MIFRSFELTAPKLHSAALIMVVAILSSPFLHASSVSALKKYVGDFIDKSYVVASVALSASEAEPSLPTTDAWRPRDVVCLRQSTRHPFRLAAKAG